MDFGKKLLFTDELSDSFLHLQRTTDSKMQYVMKWTVRNYNKIPSNKWHNCHYIRIGKKLHRLRLLKHNTRFRDANERKVFYLFLGLTPVPKCAEISISVISKGNREIQGEQNETSPGHDSTLNCFFEFLESDISHVSVLEFVALCKISVNDPSGNTSVGIRSEILSDFEHLFDNKLFSDMIVCVGDRQYNVHRLVLAARSPVFKAMFQSEMLESSESKIIIKDSDDEAFGELLRYLYVGEINPLNSDLALRLLELADKYDVSELKSQVVDYLRCELTFKNVLSILTKAHLHNEAVLKAEAIEFAAANMWELMHTSEWETFRLQLDLVDCILAFMC